MSLKIPRIAQAAQMHPSRGSGLMGLTSRFRDELKRQCRFLKTSCEMFDAGDLDEAIRIAVIVRTLFHDTKSSTSLLSHLQSPDFEMLSEADELSGLSQLPTFAAFIGGTMASTRNGGCIPCLGRGFRQRMIPRSQWWMETVMILNQKPISRRSLVLTASNKDGGAHVDEELPEWYTQLMAQLTQVTYDESIDAVVGERPYSEPYAILRQTAFEILSSPYFAIPCDDV